MKKPLHPILPINRWIDRCMKGTDDVNGGLGCFWKVRYLSREYTKRSVRYM